MRLLALLILIIGLGVIIPETIPNESLGVKVLKMLLEKGFGVTDAKMHKQAGYVPPDSKPSPAVTISQDKPTIQYQPDQVRIIAEKITPEQNQLNP